MEKKTYTLEFEADKINVIILALSKMPLEQVIQVFDELRDQINSQNEEKK